MRVRFDGRRSAAILVCSALLPLAQADTPATLACDVAITPSDSGSGRIGYVVPGAGRLLAWTDGRPGQLLMRDASGETHVIGRRGAGPGEFALIGALGWMGDTLWVHDPMNARVQYFAADGSYLSGTRLPPRATYAPRPGGRFVGFGAYQLALLTPPVAWLSARADATVPDTLATFERVVGDPVLVPAGTRDVRNPHPLMAHTVYATSPSHDRACVAIPAGANETTLRCVDDRGRIVLDKRLDLPPRPVTDAIYDSVITIFSRAPGRTPAIMRDRISRPRTLPPVAALLVSSGGSVWLQRSHHTERESRWTRVRADGTVHDSVVLPPSTRLLEIDGELVWVAIANEDGLESLASCRVIARSAR